MSLSLTMRTKTRNSEITDTTATHVTKSLIVLKNKKVHDNDK